MSKPDGQEKTFLGVDEAFRDGSVFDAPEEQLRYYLRGLSSGHVANDGVRHREVIRGITINHIQMSRVIDRLESTIERLNEENSKLSLRLLWLTIIAAA